MLVEFIGTPASGKTTTAAKLFESLKNYNVTTEFLPEEARKFIVYKRKQFNLSYNSLIRLTDQDQLKILKNQIDIELTYKNYCSPEIVIVADSSPLNALLYMTPEMRSSDEVQALVNTWKTQINPIVMRCLPVVLSHVTDCNRVHNHNEINALENLVDPLLEKYSNAAKIKVLAGPREERHQVCLAETLGELIRGAL